MHLASLLEPVGGHMQVFTPSPFGNAEKGMQRFASRLGTRQAILVHTAWVLLPEGGQMQVLQPSSL